jgi:hypothetical protein
MITQAPNPFLKAFLKRGDPVVSPWLSAVEVTNVATILAQLPGVAWFWDGFFSLSIL